MSAVNVSCSPSRSTTTPVTAVPAMLVSSRSARERVSSVTFGCVSAGRTAEHLGVGLGVHQAREAVAGGAAHAAAVGRVLLVEQHAARRVERVQPGRLEVVGELLDARLVADRRVRVGRAGVGLGRVLAARAVHLVELLGLRVVRLEHVVADRPRGRGAVVVLERAEVLRAQPVERGAVELGRPADEVVDLRLERLVVRVVPGVRRRRSGCRRTRRRPTSSAARAAASRRARAAAPACPTARAGGRASRRRRRCRSRSRRSGSYRVLLRSLGDDDARARLDQREVRERLREVPEVASGGGVELLRVEPERRRAGAAGAPSGRAPAAARRSRPAPTRARTSRSGTSPRARRGRRRSPRCGSAGRSRSRSARRRSPARSRAAAGPRRAGSRRSRRAGSRRRARRSRSAGAARRARRRRARGCRRGSPRRPRASAPACRRRRGCGRAWPRGPSRPSDMSFDET